MASFSNVQARNVFFHRRDGLAILCVTATLEAQYRRPVDAKSTRGRPLSAATPLATKYIG
jgi:hypothetical protein